MTKTLTGQQFYDMIEQENFDTEELEILEEIKNTKQFSLQNIETKKAYTFRLAQSDVEKIKAMAKQEGLPYQTLFSAIIHKVANKKITLDIR